MVHMDLLDTCGNSAELVCKFLLRALAPAVKHACTRCWLLSEPFARGRLA